MQAMVSARYGAPDVFELAEVPAPTVAAGEVLVQVTASTVTYGDRRVRAADFPGIGWLPGRLMMGLLRPKHRVQGTVYAGRVRAVGPQVTAFSVGQRVFGLCDAGAYAQQLRVSADSAIAPTPAGLSDAEAAAVPYGAVTAHHFLATLGGVTAGQRVLIVGAVGGVGRFAVQIARHLGAEVTAVCRPAHAAAARALGAERIYPTVEQALRAPGPAYDVIFDTPGVARFGACRRALTATGRFLTLSLSVGILWHMARTCRRPQRAIFGVSMGGAAGLQAVCALIEQGALRPVVHATLPLAELPAAHALAARTGSLGSVVVTVPVEGSASAAP